MTDREQRNRPSMVDVGRLAGVSAQSVSRYFTGSGYVSDEARARIAAAVAELGYVRNRTARNLRAARTDTVGLLAIGALNYGSSGVITGVGRAAREDGVTVMIAELDLPDADELGWEAEAEQAFDQFLSMGVDGVIVSSPVPGVAALLGGWRTRTALMSVAELQVSQDPPHASHSYIAGRDGTRHLLELGHRRIVHIAGPLSRNEARDRRRGYLDAMAEAGAEPAVIEGPMDWSAGSGHRAGLLCDPDSFTGAVAANDEIALGFMSALGSRGLRAPDDYSIVGVDDMPSAAFFSPALTTIRLDFTALGTDTYRILRSRIVTGDGDAVGTPDPPLIVRGSTGAPRTP